MTGLAPDSFGLALWALRDAEQEAKRARPAPTGDDFPAGSADAAPPTVISDPARYAASALDNATADLGRLAHGQRNNGLNDVAFSLGKLVGGGLLDYDQAAAFLEDACDIWPDRDPHNVRGTIRSGLAGGMRQPLAWVQGLRSTEAAPFGVVDGESTSAAPGQPAESVRAIDASSWLPLDMTPFLDGSHKPVLPSLLRRLDGVASLYPGRVHWLSGEPESLKSWLALLACFQQLIAGENVVFIDLEDSPQGMAARLIDMGLDPAVIAARFAYISPSGPLTAELREQLATVVGRASLLIVDAATEALSMQGLTPKDDVDVAKWLELLPRWAARLGPAVLVLDHVVKDAENRGRWATGSQHKLAGLDGIALLIEPVQPGGRGKTGRSRVYLAKDRHGHLGPHVVMTSGGKRHFGDLVVDGSGLAPFLDVGLHAPVAQEGEFKPTVLMTRVSEKLAAAGRTLTGSEIEDRLGARASNVRQAVAALVDDGFVEVTRGPHNSKQHRLLRPYPDEEQDAA